MRNHSQRILLLIVTDVFFAFMVTVIIYALPKTVEARYVGTYETDTRYGLGGKPSVIIDDLGIRSARHWGHNNAKNQIETTKRGGETYFVVGKIDNKSYYNGQPYTWDSRPRCKRSVTNSTIVPCRDVPKTGIPHDSTFTDIKSLAVSYPGSTWEIANEPDWGPYFFPEDYAVWFYLFSREIKRYDSNAIIMIGGMPVCCVDDLYRDDGLYALDPRIRQSNDPYFWIKTFRKYHKKTYSTYPKIDIWNLHPYVFGASKISPEDKNRIISEYVESVKNEIIKFRNFLSSIGEGGTKVYLTEFGIGSWEGTLSRGVECPSHGCLTHEEYEYEWSIEQQFMEQFTDWLASTDYVQKWFWYYYGQERLWNSNKLNTAAVMDTYKNMGLSFLQDVDVPTSLAIAYAKRAGSPILFNTSFEAYLPNENPVGWWFWAGNSTNDYWAKTETTRYSGNRGFHMHLGTPGPYGSVGTIGQSVPSNYYNGKFIRFQGWCLTKNGGKAGLKINRTDTKGVRHTNWRPGVAQPRSCSSWTKIQTSVLTIPTDTVGLEFEGMGTGQNGDIWFDDLIVIVAGDTDGDLYVSGEDITKMMTSWWGSTADFSGDGVTNTVDFALSYHNFEK